MGEQHQPERRKNARPPMSDDQFRDWTVKSLEAGAERFEQIGTQVEKVDSKVDNVDAKVEQLTIHISTLSGHVETLTAALGENTALTKQTADQSQKTAELAQKTADDTADLVRVSQFGKKVSRFGRITGAMIAFFTRHLSSLSKLLIPIFVVYAIASALWHGEPIRWKDIIEAIK